MSQCNLMDEEANCCCIITAYTWKSTVNFDRETRYLSRKSSSRLTEFEQNIHPWRHVHLPVFYIVVLRSVIIAVILTFSLFLRVTSNENGSEWQHSGIEVYILCHTGLRNLVFVCFRSLAGPSKNNDWYGKNPGLLLAHICERDVSLSNQVSEMTRPRTEQPEFDSWQG